MSMISVLNCLTISTRGVGGYIKSPHGNDWISTKLPPFMGGNFNYIQSSGLRLDFSLRIFAG